VSSEKAGEKRTHKTAIILRVLTLIGTLGSALFAGWDKIFPPPQDGPQITKPSEPTCKANRFIVAEQSIKTTRNDVIDVIGDSEIHSDDWTRVWIGYSINVSSKKIVVKIVWEAQELNKNKSFGNSLIRSQKIATLYQVPIGCTNSVITNYSKLDINSSNTQEFRGEQHTLASFTDRVGNLRDIRVRFDGPGASDDRLQELHGVFSEFIVSISATP
jgi:uncharacterized protein YjfI (DUF2170 family)